MKIIVFGGAGFVGIHLARKLKELGYSIVICDIVKPDTEDVDFVKCNITNRAEFDNIPFEHGDIVINLVANQYHHRVPRKNRDMFFTEINTKGAENLLEFVFSRNGKKVIQFSTDMVYGTPLYLPIDTKHPQNPFGPYGASKKLTEALCRKYREKGIDITIFRPRMINGPGRLGILKKLFFLVRYNLPVPVIGSGKNCYQMISVFDCVTACIKAIEAGCPNKEYNLGSKNPPTTYELLTALIKNAGKHGFVVPMPGKLVKKTLSFLAFIGIEIMYKEQYMIADEDYILDTSETENDLNWSPLYRDEDMVVQAYEDYIKRSEK